jgi:hypothetical protein
MPMGCLSLKKALVTLFSTDNGIDMAAQYLQVEYDNDEDGNPDFMSPNLIQPIDLEDFLKLPLRDFDIPISSSKMTVRAPVIILSKSKKIIMKKLRPSLQNLYDLYGGRCVWTNRVLSKNSATKEHLKPRSHGGDDSFQNVVLADKTLNNERGNSVEKWKYKMQYQPKEPIARPWASTIKSVPREEWKYFLFNK